MAHLIRYVFFFRNYIDKPRLLDFIKNISYLVRTRNDTFKQAVYHAIDNLICIKDSVDIFKPMNLYFNKTNAYPNIQYVLQNIYVDIKNSQNLEPHALSALYNIIKIMDDSCGQFADAFCDLFGDAIIKVTKTYNFNTIFLVFDSLATFITFTKVSLHTKFLL